MAFYLANFILFWPKQHRKPNFAALGTHVADAAAIIIRPLKNAYWHKITNMEVLVFDSFVYMTIMSNEVLLMMVA